MDYHLLSRVITELSERLTGGRLERIFEDDHGDFYLAVTRAGKTSTLLLSPDRALPRLHLVSKKPAAAVAPSGFAQYLRSRLPGARVAGIGLLNEDRVAEFRFARSGKEYRLLFELFGPLPNMILAEGTANILAVRRPLPAGEKASRPLLPGMAYLPPEKKPRSPGSGAERDRTGVRTGQAAAAGLSANRSAELLYDRLVHDRQASLLRKGLSAALTKALSRAERREEAIAGDLASAGRANDYRQAGELILANLKTLVKGAGTALLAGYDGRSVTVTLDPVLSPAENAGRYFRKYKKAKAGIGLIAARLGETRAEASSLRAFLVELDAAGDLNALGALQAKLAKQGLAPGRTRHPGRSAGRERTAAPPYRRFEFSGWEILVGRSAAGNDELTLKLARPHDLWLHAEGIPGSHVLVRTRKGGEVPQEVLLKAASLAAYFSRGRGAGKVPVACTQAKFVKKPKGAKPGTVTLSRRHTIMVKPEKDV